MKYEKQLLFLAVLLLFFIGYPVINEYSSGKDAAVLYTPYDGIIPFVPAWIIIYISGFLTPMLLYFFITDMIFFRRAALSYIVMLCAAYATYLIYPVTVILRPEKISSVLAPVFQLFYSVDPPYNAFPSLHVSQPLLAAMFAYHYDKKYWWMFLWAALISVSTLFTKQHYILDVISGIVLAVFAYLLFVKTRGC